MPWSPVTQLTLSHGSTRTIQLTSPTENHLTGLWEEAEPLLPTPVSEEPQRPVPTAQSCQLGLCLPISRYPPDHQDSGRCLSIKKSEQGLTRASWACWGPARMRAMSTQGRDFAVLAAWQMAALGASPESGNEIRPQPSCRLSICLPCFSL